MTLSNDFNIRLNLPVPFDEKPVCITSDSSTLPPYSGLIFPFVPALAISDESTVMTVIRNYFYGSLADSDEDAVEAFSSLKGAWGIIRNTLAGDVLSHVYKGIEMALHVQSIVTIIAPNDRYAGFLIQGGGFHLTVLDKLYMPVAYEDLKKELYRMDPHLIALSAIMKKLPFPDADSREAYMTTCDTMWKVKQAIDSMGLNEESRNAVATAAKRLSFLEDRPLTIHAANIVHVLDVIRDTSKDLATLPLHHSQLFSSSRAHMAWSAFGDHAPSFRIPGGKAIPVDKPMTRVVRTNSKKGSINETKTVTKIAYQVIPLAMALRHLDETIEKKEILNPFANQVVRVSTDFANKDLTGDSAISVMEALRRLLNVTVVDGPGKGKRKDEDDDAGPSKKKRTAFDD